MTQKTKLSKHLSIMVPALNEENNLENTIKEIEKGIDKKLINYEIMIFDDGSTDNTDRIADSLARKNRKIRVVHNRPNKGMGYCYRKGLQSAKFEYYMYIPGDNQFPKEALAKMLGVLDQADIIIPYATNIRIRPLMRQILSSFFTHLINFLFGLNVTYYNAPVIHKTALLKGALPKTDGYAYQAEILVRLIKAGASYKEVGFKMKERRGGRTSAFKLKNILRVIKAVGLLFWEIDIMGKPLVLPQTKRELDRTTNI